MFPRRYRRLRRAPPTPPKSHPSLVFTSRFPLTRIYKVPQKTQLDYSAAEFERVRALREREQRAFVEQHAEALDAALRCLDTEREEARREGEDGYAAVLGNLSRVKENLGRQSREGSTSILAQDAELSCLTRDFRAFAARAEVELGYLNDASDWTVSGSKDFLADVDEDERHVATCEVRRVAAAHDGARRRRMAHYAETFGGLAVGKKKRRITSSHAPSYLARFTRFFLCTYFIK